MNTPLITWSCIVGLFIIIMLIRLFRAATFCAEHKDRILGLMSEREEFFMPGDPNPNANADYDYEDIEDL